MKKVLLVKTSSLGDVIQNLPVASDIRRHLPEARIDWVVEEPYAPVIALHPAVHRVIPVAVRRWRHGLLGHRTWREIGEYRRLSQSETYDAIVDTQGLVKSAVLARAARGRHHGYDAASAREPLAARLYEVTHHVPRAQHAVRRNRLLAAAALGYRTGETIDYGISTLHDSGTDPYVVLLHGSARPEKLWAEESWIELGRRIEADGMRCALPWGSAEERLRSERIAAALKHAIVPTLMPLDRVADLLRGARAVAGVDTGLAHLAAALGRPVTAIYCASDPNLNGVYAASPARNVGGPGHPPTVDEVWETLRQVGGV